ncbi:MAG TPA: DUF2795 domain-containing protein [Chloroflexota bacterium]|nr:DUF2795 domain-containing protein [Chloroflexota bacterium]
MANVNPIQVQKYLSNVNYPASKSDLVDAARKEGAGQDVVETLQKMPGDTFNSPVDVSEAIGKIES